MRSTDLLEPAPGPLLIVGGAEDKTGACAVLRELVRLAGGASARIVLLTAASEFPRDVGSRYLRVLTRLEAGHVEPVHVERREQAESELVQRAIDDATAVYFSGGVQSRIADLILGTGLHAALDRRWRAGLVVGGTSAGAAAMSEVMIVGSPGPPSTRPENVVIGSGLGLAPEVIVDQHFSQRRRLSRLTRAVARHPDRLGLGIDEDTAVVVRGDAVDVIGTGTVTLVDGQASTRSAIGTRPAGDDGDRGARVQSRRAHDRSACEPGTATLGRADAIEIEYLGITVSLTRLAPGPRADRNPGGMVARSSDARHVGPPNERPCVIGLCQLPTCSQTERWASNRERRIARSAGRAGGVRAGHGPATNGGSADGPVEDHEARPPPHWNGSLSISW